MFYDEFGFSFQERLSRTWAPRGKRPRVPRVTGDRRAVSTGVGMTLSGRIYKRHFDGSMKSEAVVVTLEHLRRYLPNGFLLVWDHAPIHTSKRTKAYLAEHPEIVLEPLPKYAPELNPEEYCHGNVKGRLKNATPSDKVALRRMLDRGFARLRRRPDLLLSFVRAAGLSVKQLWLL